MSYKDHEEESLSDYLREIRKFNPLSREEEEEIGKRILEGDEGSKRRLVEHNLLFVIKLAKRYTGYGLSLQDLIEEGNVGLITAADKYDYNKGKGYRFISYAKFWIKHNIQRALDNTSRPIRISSRAYSQLSKIEKLRNCGYSDKEIEKVTGISEKRILEITSVPKTISLNNPNENNLTIEDTYHDEKYSPETVSNLYRDWLISVIDKELDKRSAEMLKLRFGFQDGFEYDLGEISQRYGISRQRVFEVQERSIKKLRKKWNTLPF